MIYINRHMDNGKNIEGVLWSSIAILNNMLKLQVDTMYELIHV